MATKKGLCPQGQVPDGKGGCKTLIPAKPVTPVKETAEEKAAKAAAAAEAAKKAEEARIGNLSNRQFRKETKNADRVVELANRKAGKETTSRGGKILKKIGAGVTAALAATVSGLEIAEKIKDLKKDDKLKPEKKGGPVKTKMKMGGVKMKMGGAKKKLTKAQDGIITTPQATSNSAGQATQNNGPVTPVTPKSYAKGSGNASKAGATGTYKKGGIKKYNFGGGVGNAMSTMSAKPKRVPKPTTTTGSSKGMIASKKMGGSTKKKGKC
jgi:hypothetical protein